jgi:RNA polymerase sigma-70 factor (ECF subfamily)
MEFDVERELRQLCDAQAYSGAATRMIEAYGPEIWTFLRSRLRNDADAAEVFAMSCEDLWRGLPNFAWRSTARAWMYAVTRNAECRFACSPHRRPERNIPLSDVLDEVVDRVRTTTPRFRQSATKDEFRQLRERLTEEDQLILVLRVDRDLNFREIAVILAGVDIGQAEIGREASRLRKRFQIIKDRLRSWAEDDGLLPRSQN